MASDKLILGRLGAPRGIKGDLRLQSYSGEFGPLE
jgi:ribosomal 30S subunit maturation factor RimM